MKTLTTITDPVYIPKEKYTWFDKFWLRFINDPRDLPFIYLLTAIHILVLPAACHPLHSLVGRLVLVAGFIFPISTFHNCILKARFGLMLHCISHRKLFKKGYTWIYHWIIWIVCPFFGHTPETYFVHHMAMHHVENNMEEDASSTLPYQRDSFRSFMIYYLISFSRFPRYVYVPVQPQKKKNVPAADVW